MQCRILNKPLYILSYDNLCFRYDKVYSWTIGSYASVRFVDTVHLLDRDVWVEFCGGLIEVWGEIDET